MSLLAYFGDSRVEYQSKFVRKDENLRVPDVGRYVKIKHDWDVLGDTRQVTQGTKVRYAFPAIVNKEWGWRVNGDVSPYYHPMPDAWQWFLWSFWDWSSNYLLETGRIESTYTKKTNSGTFAKCTPGSLTWLYVDMIEKSRAWTDSLNVETGAKDVVTGRNLTAKNPYGWLLRPTTGHMLKVIGETSTTYDISCININNAPPTMREVEEHPEWICWATQVHIEKYVSRFPQVKECFEVIGLPPQGTAIPLLAPGGVAQIKKTACTPLQNGAYWSPYE